MGRSETFVELNLSLLPNLVCGDSLDGVGRSLRYPTSLRSV